MECFLFLLKSGERSRFMIFLDEFEGKTRIIGDRLKNVMLKLLRELEEL